MHWCEKHCDISLSCVAQISPPPWLPPLVLAPLVLILWALAVSALACLRWCRLLVLRVVPALKLTDWKKLLHCSCRVV